ncbi:hypothetical protein AOLI_G00192310 [Acnodon oligacanthus]
MEQLFCSEPVTPRTDRLCQELHTPTFCLKTSNHRRQSQRLIPFDWTFILTYSISKRHSYETDVAAFSLNWSSNHKHCCPDYKQRSADIN